MNLLYKYVTCPNCHKDVRVEVVPKLGTQTICFMCLHCCEHLEVDVSLVFDVVRLDNEVKRE